MADDTQTAEDETGELDDIDGKFLGTLDLHPNASAQDIEAMLDYGLETAVGIQTFGNEDGTYAVFDMNADPVPGQTDYIRAVDVEKDGE